MRMRVIPGTGCTCYTVRMHGKVVMAAALFCASSVWALPRVSFPLPSPVYADTETVTNVPFTASLDAAGRFRLSLACLATPTNNVEAAVDGASAFAELGAREPRRHELAAGWLYRREWNMVKLTGRGLDGHGEAFAVQVLPDAFFPGA